MKKIEPTRRTRLKRLPKRGNFERETINAILDEAFICHIGFVADGQPYVIPTAFGRVGDDIYVHGSSASRMLRDLSAGIEMCLTVTHVDALVLARSAFHHSINYRSVVVLGNASLITDDEEKNTALEAITEHIVPGRWKDVRWPNALELKATSVLKLRVDEASAKLRTGGPIDDEEDYEIDVWAGLLPLKVTAMEPIDDERLPEGKEQPEYVREYRR